MLEIIDAALEKLLRREIGLEEDQVDVVFAAPDKSWSANVGRPTLNVYLWDISRNPAYASNGLLQRVGGDGRVERRSSAPFVDIRYFVTAWAPMQTDEHRLLGQVLACLLAQRAIPADDLPDTLPGRHAIDLQFASQERRKPDAFWGAVEGRLRPGVDLVITLPVDVFSWVTAAPEVTSISAATRPEVPPKPSTGEPPPALTRRRSGGAVITEASR